MFNLAALVAALVARKRLPSFGEPSDGRFAVLAAMDGAEFVSETDALLQGSVVAFFGGVRLDLTAAEPAPAAHLTLRSVFGGIDVIVPNTWRVEVAGRSVMGGVGNLTSPDDVDSEAPVLLVDALAVFGGIEIHSKEVA